MNNFFVELAGWIPAIVFPVATGLQLVTMFSKKTSEGVSVITWAMFGFANIGLYIYAEKYFSIQSMIGFLGTAILDFIIVGACLIMRKNKEL